MPLISVITVSFNSEEYISQCIQSVIFQDYSDFEYIVIDGASTDNTRNIIESYSDKIAYWHSLPDRGLSHAFNIGIDIAEGEWIAFLNSDDFYVDRNVLNDMAQVLDNTDDCDVVYGGIQLIRRCNDIIPVSDKIGASWSWKEYRKYSSIPHPAAFTNSRYFESHGMFNEKHENALDYELYLRAGADLKAVYVNKLVAYMRIGGMSNELNGKSIRESRDAQINNKAQGRVMAYIWWFYLRLRQSIKSFLHG